MFSEIVNYVIVVDRRKIQDSPTHLVKHFSRMTKRGSHDRDREIPPRAIRPAVKAPKGTVFPILMMVNWSADIKLEAMIRALKRTLYPLAMNKAINHHSLWPNVTFFKDDVDRQHRHTICSPNGIESHRNCRHRDGEFSGQGRDESTQAVGEPTDDHLARTQEGKIDPCLNAIFSWGMKIYGDCIRRKV